MSLLIKILVPVIVLGIGIWALVKNQSMTPPPQVQEQAQAMQPATSTGPTPDEIAAQHAADTSDTGIDADVQDLDAQLDAATQSAAAVDQSFNDKQVSQN